MGLNLKKTNIVHFRRKLRSKPRSTYPFTFNEEEISYASQYKYLGLILNEHLDWSASLEVVITKANRALALLNHRMRATGGFHFKTYSLLFNQLVQPIIMTNACIWGHREYPKITNIQHRALRYFLGVGKTCPIVGLFGETGWIPFRALIRFNILKFWHRVTSMQSHRLTRRIYVWSKSLADAGTPNWVKRTTDVLGSLYKGNLLHQGHAVNDIWDAVMSQELLAWKSSVGTIPNDSETGGRLRFYRCYKSEPAPTPYIYQTISTNRRRIITMLKCGCLPLEVETGRYRYPKTPINRRTCQLCNGDIEDEIHFLNICPALQTLRIQLYKVTSESNIHDRVNLYSLPVHQTTILILQLCAENPVISKLIYDMFLHRKLLLQR